MIKDVIIRKMGEGHYMVDRSNRGCLEVPEGIGAQALDPGSSRAAVAVPPAMEKYQKLAARPL
jgi:hypothetical protein